MFTSSRRLPRLGLLPRVCAVGICLLLALQSAAQGRAGAGRAGAGQGGAGPVVPVVVAARALAAGHALVRSDLRLARWPSALRPAGAPGEPTPLLGRRLTGPVAAGEPLLGTRVLGPDLAARLPAGLVAAAVAIADSHVVDLVRPGDRVDLLASPRADGFDAQAAGMVRTLARDALAIAVFRAAEGAELVLALPRAAAVDATRTGASAVFTVVLAPP